MDTTSNSCMRPLDRRLLKANADAKATVPPTMNIRVAACSKCPAPDLHCVPLPTKYCWKVTFVCSQAMPCCAQHHARLSGAHHSCQLDSPAWQSKRSLAFVMNVVVLVVVAVVVVAVVNVVVSVLVVVSVTVVCVPVEVEVVTVVMVVVVVGYAT